MNYLIEVSLLLLGFVVVFYFLLDGDNVYGFYWWYLVGSFLVFLVIFLIVWLVLIVIEIVNYVLLFDFFLGVVDEGVRVDELSMISFRSVLFIFLIWGFWLGVIYKIFVFI